ncbi:MAG: type II secretion system F family protein [Candidatus Altiarchaeota archaeon]|nr:type II secretion system F family protein [Candidatus Altiarchaeota archaeon]
MNKIPLMVVPIGSLHFLAARFRGFGGKVSKIFPKIHGDINEAGLRVDADEYIAYCLLSSGLISAAIACLLSTTIYILGAETQRILLIGTLSSTAIFTLFFLVLISYPNILAGKKAELLERDLIYALKDMHLEVLSGITIYSALNGVAKGGYGEVSKEFEKIVDKSNVGVPIDEALETLALRTRSEHLRHSIWQIVNSMRSGSSIEDILRELTLELTTERKTKIRQYSQDLNVLILMYMLFAVVVPTIATTLIIVLGPFMGVNIGVKVFYIILPLCFFIQISLVGYIKSRRPMVYL